MGEIRFEIIEDTFQRSNSSSKELSVLLGTDSFSYTINNTQLVIGVLKEYYISPEDDYIAEVEKILQTDKRLQQPFRKVRLSVDNNLTTIVPSDFYEQKNRLDYLVQMFNHTLEGYSIFSDSQEGCEGELVYAIEDELIQRLERLLPGFHLSHTENEIIEKLFFLQQLPTNIYLHIRGFKCRIIAFQEGQLAFSNQFTYLNASDLLYNVLLVYKQLRLSIEEHPLFITGTLTQESEIYRTLYQYIRDVKFVDTSYQWKFGAKLKKWPKHFFFDLLSVGFKKK